MNRFSRCVFFLFSLLLGTIFVFCKSAFENVHYFFVFHFIIRCIWAKHWAAMSHCSLRSKFYTKTYTKQKKENFLKDRNKTKRGKNDWKNEKKIKWRLKIQSNWMADVKQRYGLKHRYLWWNICTLGTPKSRWCWTIYKNPIKCVLSFMVRHAGDKVLYEKRWWRRRRKMFKNTT